MNAERKKQLKQQYREYKPDMGIIGVRCLTTGSEYLCCDRDVKGTINSTLFSLGAGGHPNKALQAQWNQYGAENFTIEVLEQLPYEKDNGEKTDYSEDLQVLLEIWMEKTPGARKLYG